MLLKRSPNPVERRRFERRVINRTASVRAHFGALLGNCLVTDISEGGVRVHVEAFQLPDEFELLISGDGVPGGPLTCQVVWRLGYEAGAKFIGDAYWPARAGQQ
jgi:PilZ domain